MSGRGRDSLRAARRPPHRGGARGSRGGGRDRGDEGDGGHGGSSGSGREGRLPRFFLPVLFAAVLALTLSALWRWQMGAPERTAPHPRALAAKSDLTPVRIEILNGSGEPGAAAKLASYLRERGFHVVSVGSADRYDYLRTLVVARTHDDRGATEVADDLGDVVRIRQRTRSEADVTVIVGRDRGRLPWGEGREPKGRS